MTQVLAALAVGFIIWVALAQSEAGKLDLATFASYHGRADHAARAAEGAVGHQRRDPARPRRRRKHLRPPRSRRGAGPRHAWRCERARGELTFRPRVAALCRHRARGAQRRLARRSARARPWRWSAVGQRQDVARQPACRASTSPRPAGCSSTATTSRRSRSRACGRRSRWCRRTWCCSTTRSPPTSPTAR